MRFSRSANVFDFGDSILVELIDLVNSIIIFLSQTTLLRWLTFLCRSQTIILIALLFWTYFFLLMLVFVLQWLSLHWEILIMLLSQFPLTFHQIHNGMPHFISRLWLLWYPLPQWRWGIIFQGQWGVCFFIWQMGGTPLYGRNHN